MWSISVCLRADYKNMEAIVFAVVYWLRGDVHDFISAPLLTDRNSVVKYGADTVPYSNIHSRETDLVHQVISAFQ